MTNGNIYNTLKKIELSSVYGTFNTRPKRKPKTLKGFLKWWEVTELDSDYLFPIGFLLIRLGIYLLIWNKIKERR